MNTTTICDNYVYNRIEQTTSETPRIIGLSNIVNKEFLFSLRNRSVGSKFIQVSVEQTIDGKWLASSPEIDSYGVGFSAEDAKKNFNIEIRSYYIDLITDEEILGPHLKSELEKLKKYFM